MQSYCVFESHAKEVNCCAFSNQYFVTCSGDKTVRVYSSHTFHELSYSPISAFKYGVNFVTFNGTGNVLAAACKDGSTYLFNLSDTDLQTSGKLVHSGGTTVQVCDFSNNGYFLVTGLSDGFFGFWDVQTKKLIRQISGHPEQNVYATAFSPCDQFIVTGSGLGDLKVWDLTTFQVTAQTQAHSYGISSSGVSSIKFSPSFHSSTVNASRTYLLATCGQDNKATLWFFNVESRSLNKFHELSLHHGPVTCCAFSLDGETLATCSYDKSIILWDPIAGTLKLELLGHDSMVTSVAFSKYGFLASTSFDKKVIVWKDGLNRLYNEMFASDLINHPMNKRTSTDLVDTNTPSVPSTPASSQPVRLEEWSCDDVASWLSGLRLEQYREIFQRNAIDGEELRNLTTESLHKDLGIAALGHRNKILRAIDLLKNAM